MRFPFVTTLLTTTLLSVLPQAHAADLAELQKKGTIRIAIANEIPYGYIDLDGKAKGVGPEVISHIVKQLGIEKIDWQPTNFGSLIPGLKANRFDLVAAEMAILPQRCTHVLFSEPNSSYGEGLLVAQGNPKNLHSYDDFKSGKHKVAIMAGADQLEMMQALGVDESLLVTIATNADAISTVSTGRADAYAATGLTAAQLAQQSSKVELAANFTDPILNGTAVRSWGGFTFDKSSKSLQEAVNTELEKFKQTKEWQDILEGYGFNEKDRAESKQYSTAELCANS